MTDRTTEDRIAYYWLQVLAEFHLKDEPGRQMMLEVARMWDSLAESLKRHAQP